MTNLESPLIANKLYSVMLYDGWRDKYCDPFLVLGSAHFNGILIAHSLNKLVFNLENNKGSVIIPFENINWMVPIDEKKEERSWLDDL